MSEHTNPDGTVVRAYGGLQGSVGLYVEFSGQRIEAVAACADFIAKVRSLVQAARAAEPVLTPPGTTVLASGSSSG
jgi:hypothetical protein